MVLRFYMSEELCSGFYCVCVNIFLCVVIFIIFLKH